MNIKIDPDFFFFAFSFFFLFLCVCVGLSTAVSSQAPFILLLSEMLRRRVSFPTPRCCNNDGGVSRRQQSPAFCQIWSGFIGVARSGCSLTEACKWSRRRDRRGLRSTRVLSDPSKPLGDFLNSGRKLVKEVLFEIASCKVDFYWPVLTELLASAAPYLFSVSFLVLKCKLSVRCYKTEVRKFSCEHWSSFKEFFGLKGLKVSVFYTMKS